MHSSKETIAELRQRMIKAKSDHAKIDGIPPDALASLFEFGIIRLDDNGAYFTEEGIKEAMEKRYHGYGYHGGGRKKMDPSEKKVYKNITISGTPEELEELKELAKRSGKTTSRFVLEKCLEKNDD